MKYRCTQRMNGLQVSSLHAGLRHEMDGRLRVEEEKWVHFLIMDIEYCWDIHVFPVVTPFSSGSKIRARNLLLEPGTQRYSMVRWRIDDLERKIKDLFMRDWRQRGYNTLRGENKERRRTFTVRKQNTGFPRKVLANTHCLSGFGNSCPHEYRWIFTAAWTCFS